MICRDLIRKNAELITGASRRIGCAVGHGASPAHPVTFPGRALHRLLHGRTHLAKMHGRRDRVTCAACAAPRRDGCHEAHAFRHEHSSWPAKELWHAAGTSSPGPG